MYWGEEKTSISKKNPDKNVMNFLASLENPVFPDNPGMEKSTSKLKEFPIIAGRLQTLFNQPIIGNLQ